MTQRIAALIPILNRYRDKIPLGFLVGWIAVESGGCVGTVTTACERGYFQIHPEESARLKIEHGRLSTAREYSVIKGIELVKDKATRAQRLGFIPGTDLFWHFVKLQHWLPKGPAETLRLMDTHKFKTTTWEEFKQFMMTHRAQLLQMIGTKEGTGWDPARGIANAYKVFKLGPKLTRKISGG